MTENKPVCVSNEEDFKEIKNNITKCLDHQLMMIRGALMFRISVMFESFHDYQKLQIEFYREFDKLSMLAFLKTGELLSKKKEDTVDDIINCKIVESCMEFRSKITKELLE